MLLVGCAREPAGTVAGGPTWHADIAPLVAERCGACHVRGGVGPFPLDTWAAAAPMAASMVAAVDAGTMPPWGAETTDECAPRFGFEGDPRLSDAEKAMLRAWAEAGAPEGDPADAAELPAGPSLVLEDPDQQLTPDRAYTTSGDRDEFRCFSLDPGLTEDRWLTGLQVVPGNEAVVHHVIVFTDPSGESAGRVGPDGTYGCFGGSGVVGMPLGAWAPGATPFRAPPGTGIRVPAGARVVMQVHYHPAGEVAEPDATTLQLQWADHAPEREAVLALLGNAANRWQGLLPGPNDRDEPEFRIPAGAAGHTETIEYPLPFGGLSIFSVATHMHYIGTGMLVQIDHARPTAAEGEGPECLVHTPRWDFDWQRGYAYDAPLDEVPTLRGGDVLRLRCTYDNTLDNPGTRTALEDAGREEPVDVYLGEETLDEMCLVALGIVL